MKTNEGKNADKEPSRGVSFFDKYSPVKFLTVDDDRPYKQGDVVFVGTDKAVYGPYRLDVEIGKGNGKVHWKAYSLEGSKNSGKPLTKDELQQENARKDAALEKARADYRAKTGEEPTF